MVSTIDITKPVQGSPTTDSVRTNFQRAYNEITALQNLSNSYLPIVGGIVDNLTINHEFYIGNPVGSYVWASTDFNAMPTIQLNSSPTDSGSLIVISKGDKRRWIIQSGTIGGNDETGTGNVGSNLTINSYDDDGLNLGNILTINRSTGFSSFKKSVYFESDIRVGTSTSQKAIKMVGAAGQGRPIQWITGDADLASGMRWQIGLTSTAESGSNVGSDLVIQRFSDVGVALTPHAFTLNRATGLLTLQCGLYLNAGVASSVTDLSKHFQIASGYGINYTANRFNIVSAGGISSYIAGAERVYTTSGYTRFGDGGAVASSIYISAAAGVARQLIFASGTTSIRWSLNCPTAGLETGANAGSDISLGRFDDSGAYIGAAWTISRATGLTTYGAGVSFGNSVAASNSDLSRHLSLGGSVYGINYTSGRMNIVSAGAVWHVTSAGVDIGSITATGLNAFPIGATTPAAGTFTTVKTGSTTGPTWTTGTAVPSAAEPIGSLYSKTNGTVGATLYVRSTGSVWTPIAGV